MFLLLLMSVVCVGVGCGCVWVCEGVGICVQVGWLSVLEGCGCGRREEKLHHYVVFVTLSSLVHEQILVHQPEKGD